MKKKIKVLIILLAIAFLWFFLVILAPSYESYKLACLTPEIWENETLINQSVAGYFDEETCEIRIYYPEGTREYNKTLVHEKCHHQQFIEGRIYGCDEDIGLFFNEIECYLKEYFS